MTADTLVDGGFCTANNVADELPQFSPFTATSRPTLALVQKWVAEEADQMRNAVASGGYLSIEEPLTVGSNIERWFRDCNIDGAKMRFGRWLYSYGPTGDAEVPWQSEFPEKVSQLRRGTIIFPEDDFAQKNRYDYVADDDDDDGGGGGTTPTPTPTPATLKIAWGWSLDNMADADEFPESAQSTTNELVVPALPTGETSAYALLWRADSAGAPNGLSIPMSLSDLGIFGSETALELDGVAGQVRVTGFRQGDGNVGKTATVSF